MSSESGGPGPAGATPEPLCPECGQLHPAWENHLYNYALEVDDDLVCHICLQPLVQPLDTPCGHTFCARCLRSFLQEKDFCPLDRARLLLPFCRRSSILVHNLLDKLTVTCPLSPACSHSMPRGELEAHLKHRCPGMQSLRVALDLSASETGGVVERAAETATPAKPQRELNSPSPPGGGSHACSGISMWTDEPGLDNPAFEESNEEDSVHGLECDPPRAKRPLSNPCAHLLQPSSPCPESPPPLADDGCVKLPALPEGEMTSIEVQRPHPYAELGVSIVGGNETPLINVVIQEVYRDGTIAQDGRLLAGDQILQVNDVDISDVPHAVARATLSRPCSLLRLTVLRERRWAGRLAATPASPALPEGSVRVTLHKRDSAEQLGIKLVRRTDEAGVFVLDLLEGGLAARDGRLCSNDRVLAVNEHDLRHGTPEQAAHFIQASGERVHLLIGRPSKQTPSPAPGSTAAQEVCCYDSHLVPPHSCPSPVVVHQRPNSHRDLSQCVTCQEKTVYIEKEPQESLGMTVAGGRSSKSGELPIFVTSVQPHGCLSRDGRIRRGDVLLSINGQDLTHLSHSEAVGTLKASAVSGSVQLRALQISTIEGQGPAAEDPPLTHDIWSPSWVMWLGLPSYLHCTHEIVLRRNHLGSWGFSIVGGCEQNHGNQPFFIKTIVLGTPAYNDGRLRCGDMIVAVNGLPTAGMSHSALVPMLKEQRSRVALTVVSWPGSLA